MRDHHIRRFAVTAPSLVVSLVLMAPTQAARGASQEVVRTVRIAVAPAESLAVTYAGRGPPVILVPGLLGSSFTYRKVMARLVAEGYSALVVDPLGIGASSKPAGADYSLTAQADRLAAVLDTLGVRNAVAVCHAVGASVCYRTGYRHPGVLAGILSLNGGPAERAGTPGLRLALKLAPILRVFGDIRGRVRKGLVESSRDPSWVTEAVVDGYLAPFGDDLDDVIGGLKRLAHATEPEPLAPNLSSIAIPVLLMATSMPAEDVARLREQLPSMVVDTSAGGGEFIQEEDPGAVVRGVAALQRRVAVGT
jgi:pimeloyl-ACP methyl ester carboxylesterase